MPQFPIDLPADLTPSRASFLCHDTFAGPWLQPSVMLMGRTNPDAGWHRAMRIFDGPREVRLRTIARRDRPGENRFRCGGHLIWRRLCEIYRGLELS